MRTSCCICFQEDFIVTRLGGQGYFIVNVFTSWQRRNEDFIVHYVAIYCPPFLLRPGITCGNILLNTILFKQNILQLQNLFPHI